MYVNPPHIWTYFIFNLLWWFDGNVQDMDWTYLEIKEKNDMKTDRGNIMVVTMVK